MRFGFILLDRASRCFNRLSIRPVLNCLAINWLSIGSSLLGLLSVVVLLEVLLSHFPLNDHQTRVDERLLEELALEHSD